MSDPELFYKNSLQAFKDMNPKATQDVIDRHSEILNNCKNKSENSIYIMRVCLPRPLF